MSAQPLSSRQLGDAPSPTRNLAAKSVIPSLRLDVSVRGTTVTAHLFKQAAGKYTSVVWGDGPVAESWVEFSDREVVLWLGGTAFDLSLSHGTGIVSKLGIRAIDNREKKQ